MPQQKRRPDPTRKPDPFLAARRAAAAPPQSDPDGWCHEQIAELARETGRDVGDLLDWWGEFAAVREYDGGYSRQEAERLAVEQVREIAQKRHAV